MNTLGYLVDGDYCLYLLFDPLTYVVIVFFLFGMLLDGGSTIESLGLTTYL